MDNKNWAYGILEAEGTIWVGLHKNGRGESSLTIRLIVTTTREGITDKLKNNFGGTTSGKILESKKTLYRWVLSGKKATILIDGGWRYFGNGAKKQFKPYLEKYYKLRENML